MFTANIPMAHVWPIKICGPHMNEDVHVPLATYELPLWPSTNRGAKISRLAGGINVVVVDDRMTRSILLEAPNALRAVEMVRDLEQRHEELNAIITNTSNYAKLLDIHSQIVGTLVYLRIECSSGDASGHNMVTQASQHIMNWLLDQYSDMQYVSVSANYCTDKKVSAVNGILGRGKYVIAEVTIPKEICSNDLRTTAQKIVELNTKKNLIGTTLAGGLRTANAHFANILLAAYLATGQDAANIVEGSQGIVYADNRNDDLYFSVTLPNIIVGTVGNGKGLNFVQKNLADLGCLEQRAPGENATRLAVIIAATVLCGELSLMAALTNPGELMRSHLLLERKKA